MPSRKQNAASVASPPPAPTYVGPWYVIDPTWYQTHGAALDELIRARRMAGPKASESKGGHGKAKRGKGLAAWEEEMNAVADSAARNPDYVTSDTPLLEAVFRVLLAERNRPIALQELVELIRQRYARGEFPRDVNVEALQRLLERQTSYGLKRLETAAPASA